MIRSTQFLSRGALGCVFAGIVAGCSDPTVSFVPVEKDVLLLPMAVAEICDRTSATGSSSLQACVEALSPMGLRPGVDVLSITSAEPTFDTETVGVPLASAFPHEPPPVPCAGCVGFHGTLAATGSIGIEPAGALYIAAAGTHTMYLRGPADTEFDIHLAKFNFVLLGWELVAGGGGLQDLQHTGPGGFYVVLVHSRQGAGPYDFWLEEPPAPVSTGLIPPETFVGAGDIAWADFGFDCGAATALLLDEIPGAVFALGDLAYPEGTAEQFGNCYDPTWGRHFDRTFPAPGNHEYDTPGASGYYDYFGTRAGTVGEGYYSFDLGAWHIISLNSNIDMGPSSPQVQWLQADLAANSQTCTLAFWHDPRFSSGLLVDPGPLYLWLALYGDGADVILVGHDHGYERFAPQDWVARADPTGGITQFVVGTGGAGHGGVVVMMPNSEARNDTDYGVLQLTLHEIGYDWEFVPIAGGTFTDAGSASCH